LIRKVIKYSSELDEFLSKFNTKLFSLDTETTSLIYTEIELVGISLCDGNSACYIDMYKDFDNLITIIHKLIDNAETIIAHNIVYDMKVLHKYGITFNCKNIYCTMVADHLINENRRHGLKYLSSTILGKVAVDYSMAEKAGIHSDTFYTYATNDAIWTFELFEYQKEALIKNNLLYLFNTIEMPFQFCLLDMEINGLLIDVNKIKEVRDVLKKAIYDFTLELYNELGETPVISNTIFGGNEIVPTINFNSGDTLRDILYNKLKLPIIEKTDTGKASTGKVVMEKYKDTVSFVSILNKFKIANKLYDSFFSEEGQIIRNLEKDNRVRPSINDCGTKTGRLSMSNPNCQQLAKPNKDFPIVTRSVFIVEDGRKMIVADFGSQEVCVAAELSKDPTLTLALINGHDVHLAVANSTYELGIPIDCLSKKHEKYEYYKKKFKNERTRAKMITFGILYGKGAYGFAKDFNVSEDEAQLLIDKFFKGMPKVKDAITKTHEEVNSTGYVTYMSGRKRRFEKISNGNWTGYSRKSLRQAFNACIQGYSSDMMRLALIKVREESKLYKEYDIRLLSTVHDELIIDCKEEYANEVKKLVNHCMTTCVNFEVPITVDIDIVSNYGDAK